jgi:hypothetical protein
VASPAVAVALGSNTVTMAAAVTAAITNTVTTSITITVASTVAATVAATGSSTAAPPTVREGRGCRQGGHHQSEHEHSESCHVAAPP